jgi:DNA-binding NtrC family response regulator
MTGPLQGCKVLIFEDEFLIASLLQEMLETAGCMGAGPIPRVAEAVDAADRDTYDAAILDINVAGHRIDPVAGALAQRSVPFVFVIGYSTGALPPNTPTGHASVSPSEPRTCWVRWRAS